MNEIINVCLELMSVVCMIVKRHSSGEVSGGRLAGFFHHGMCSCFVCRCI